MTTLVTGSAGFIGHHVALDLLRRGEAIVGLDNYTPYYDPRLKEARTARLAAYPGFTEVRLDVADAASVLDVFARHKPRRVIHLAAQAGVRHSLENPWAYLSSNVTGFLSILEACRAHPPEHLVFASTSSVYGANALQPYSPHVPADHPLSLYAATKRSNEMMAHSYAHLFGLPSTGLRFFTVYGPWGRPDMALFLFTKAMLAGKPIKVFNNGDMARDFTYIDDIVAGVIAAADHIPAPAASAAASTTDPDPATSPVAPFAVLNIGNGRPVPLLHMIELLEESLGVKATKDMQPMHPGDVSSTWADISDLTAIAGPSLETPLEVGIPRFVAWYKEFYGDA